MHLKQNMDTYSLVGVGGDAQGFLQAAAVFVHAQGEISVAFIHSSHPLFDLPSMTVAFLTESISQLDQQLHTLLSLLLKWETQRYMCTHIHTHTHVINSEEACLFVCVRD